MKMSLPLFTGWYIDPYEQLVRPIHTTDSLHELAQLIGTAEIGFFCHQPDGDLAILAADAGKQEWIQHPLDAQPMQLPRAPAWQWLPSMDLFYGRALWVSLHPQLGLQTPACSKAWLEERIDFCGFTDLTNSEEEATDHTDESDYLNGDADYFQSYLDDNDVE